MKKCNVMKYEKRILALLWSVILPIMVFASNEKTDTLTVDTLKCHEIKTPYRFRPTQLIIPGVLIGAGFIGLESDWLYKPRNKRGTSGASSFKTWCR